MYEGLQINKATLQGSCFGNGDGGVQEGRLIDRPSPTLAQNIDFRIENLKAQVARLENVKRLLAEPAGLLAVPIDDLRFAMNY